MSINTTSTSETTAFPNVQSTMESKQMLKTLMVQNRMSMELLNVQRMKLTDEITFTLDFHKLLFVFNRLNPGFQVLDWINTVNSVANLNR